MQFDYAAVREGRQKVGEIFVGLDWHELPKATAELFDQIDGIVGKATDAAVVFQPTDPHLQNPAEAAFTLGHVVVHLTAGAEEAAALGAQLARGVPVEGRSRYETDWETVKTAAQLRQRLAESRRMCLAFLNAWPDPPHLDLEYTVIERFGPLNCVSRHMMGLMHADGHLDQLREIMRQAM